MKASALTLILSLVLLSCTVSRPRGALGSGSQTGKQSLELAEDHYLSGALYDFERRHLQALREYQQALLLDSSSAQIRKAIGRNYIRLNRYPEAISYLEAAVKRNNTDLESLHYLAEAYFETKNHRKAAYYYERLRELDPYDAAIYQNLVYLYTQLGEIDALITVREAQAELLFYEREITIHLWRLYLQTRQLDKAVALSQRLVDQHPDDVKLWIIHGSSLEIASDTSNAILAYQQALALDSTNEQALGQISTLYALRQDWQGMETFFTSFLVTNPGNAVARLLLTESYLARSQFAMAETTIQPLLSDTAQAAQANLILGRMALQQDRPEDARTRFREATRLEPLNIRAWELLTILYFQNQDFAGVEPLLQEALELLPDAQRLLSLYGNTLQQLGQMQAAVTPLKRAYQLAPDDFNTIVTLGIVYDELKMYDELDTLFGDALKRFPDNALLLNNYSYSLAVRGIDLDTAQVLAQKALAADPGNAAYHDTVGWIFFKQNLLVEALANIQRSLELDPNNPEVIEHLGDVYSAMGEADLARQYWQQALEMNPENNELRIKWQNQ